MSDANVLLPDPIAPPAYSQVKTVARAGDGFWGKGSFSFANVLDVVNPLQHIPVVGSIYRAVTVDQISPGARIAGGTLFSSPIGFAAAVANLVVEDSTGIDVGKSAMAIVTGRPEAAFVAAPAPQRADPAKGEGTLRRQLCGQSARTAHCRRGPGRRRQCTDCRPGGSDDDGGTRPAAGRLFRPGTSADLPALPEARCGPGRQCCC